MFIYYYGAFFCLKWCFLFGVNYMYLLLWSFFIVKNVKIRFLFSVNACEFILMMLFMVKNRDFILVLTYM